MLRILVIIIAIGLIITGLAFIIKRKRRGNKSQNNARDYKARKS